MAHVLHVNSVVDGVDPWDNAADMITFATERDPLSLYLIFPLYPLSGAGSKPVAAAMAANEKKK